MAHYKIYKIKQYVYNKQNSENMVWVTISMENQAGLLVVSICLLCIITLVVKMVLTCSSRRFSPSCFDHVIWSDLTPCAALASQLTSGQASAALKGRFF